MISAKEALDRLRAGNRRYVEERPLQGTVTAEQRAGLTAGQFPFAVVLGCSDSRVPAEIVFDQGVGDLFVIRVAGNIVAPSQVGSVEFAAAMFNLRLVVVLGHTQCGAVKATLDELARPVENRSPNLRSIVDRIRPAVLPLVEAHPGIDPSELAARATRSNVRASTDHLRHGSAILERLIEAEGLRVVGAEYSLETGGVDFFDRADL